jgi:hypothetical protein
MALDDGLQEVEFLNVVITFRSPEEIAEMGEVK